MLLSLRENGLTSLFKEVRVFKEREALHRGLSCSWIFRALADGAP